MAKKIAVISDATSSKFWFPYWHRYYSRHFGETALHLVTYNGKGAEFSNFKLGGIWELPVDYNDQTRALVISALTSALLRTYDVIIRCDVDEFIVSDPRKYKSLKDYVEQCDKRYVTALGIDIFENVNEPPFIDGEPIVGQRKFAILNSALNKIALTTVPAEWGGGFHGSSLYPMFDNLYLLHAKWARVENTIRWHGYMRGQVPKGGSEETYFSGDESRLTGTRLTFSSRPVVPAWQVLDDPSTKTKFLNSVVYGYHLVRGDFYQGKFEVGAEIFEIPPEMYGVV